MAVLCMGHLTTLILLSPKEQANLLVDNYFALSRLLHHPRDWDISICLPSLPIVPELSS